MYAHGSRSEFGVLLNGAALQADSGVILNGADLQAK
jgi:hypothetical protein